MTDSSKIPCHSKTNHTGAVRCTYTRAIGIDIHSQILVCAYQCYDPQTNELRTENAKFGTKRTELNKFATWVKNREPEIVLMESTGVYWFTPYKALEDVGFTNEQLAVVNARDIKAAHGRKSDKADAIRLCEFARMNSFKRSFVPGRDIRAARQIGRNLSKAIGNCSREANRIQKTLSAEGTRISSVFSSFKGKTAQTVLNSFLDDSPREFRKCVKDNCTRVKASYEEIVDAFHSIDNPRVKQLLRIQRQTWVEACEKRDQLIDLLRLALKDYESTIKKICEIPGINELSALKIVSEIGDDLSSFRSVESFCSWIGICCGNNESAGKQKGGSIPKGNSYLRSYLAEIGQAIGLMKIKQTILKSCFQAFKERRGHKRAVIAIAHKIARIIYALLKHDTHYMEIDSSTLKDVRVNRLKCSIRNVLEIGISAQPIRLIDDSNGEIIGEVPATS